VNPSVLVDWGFSIWLSVSPKATGNCPARLIEERMMISFLPAASHVYLERSAQSLTEAINAIDDVPHRYASAHVSALQAAAALLAARARPASGRSRSQKNVWVLLAEVAPEFSEWADFFAAGAKKRAAAEAGITRMVTMREADDLVREADRFLALIETSLGLAPHVACSVTPALDPRSA
jgi:hypothetical protein